MNTEYITSNFSFHNFVDCDLGATRLPLDQNDHDNSTAFINTKKEGFLIKVATTSSVEYWIGISWLHEVSNIFWESCNQVTSVNFHLGN